LRSRDAIRLSACSVRFSIWRDPVRCATLHHVTAGFDRYSRRARITRATQLVMPKYRVPKDVTYDTERLARTARILVGNESLIVNDPPPSPLLPHHVQFGVRGLLMNRMTGNRACHVALCRYKYMLLYFLLHLGWLCCLKTQSIF